MKIISNLHYCIVIINFHYCSLIIILLIDIFIGGYTHANMLDTAITIENVGSYDLTSSYPAVMVFEKYPMTKFLKISYNYEKYMNDVYKSFDSLRF